ncbi:hypothetical protein CTT31_06620 [Pseudoalteromonas maricaloris]|nr:hypothetical protein CTT31_06620 [Pseudoalteromonas flavipulchra]
MHLFADAEVRTSAEKCWVARGFSAPVTKCSAGKPPLYQTGFTPEKELLHAAICKNPPPPLNKHQSQTARRVNHVISDWFYSRVGAALRSDL